MAKKRSSISLGKGALTMWEKSQKGMVANKEKGGRGGEGAAGSRYVKS